MTKVRHPSWQVSQHLENRGDVRLRSEIAGQLLEIGVGDRRVTRVARVIGGAGSGLHRIQVVGVLVSVGSGRGASPSA